MKRVLVLALAGVLLALSAAPALAATGREYAQHIVEHAHGQHFSGEMNPGHHHGFAGFEEHHEH